MSYEVARRFWTTINNYPDYPHLLKRRFIDLVCILGKLEDATSITDIGCGDCSMLILLQELTPMKKLYGFDISSKMMREVPNLILQVRDLTKDCELPMTDVTTCFGMFPYIFDEEDLHNILKNVNSDLFIVRSPCTSQETDEYINKFSEELGHKYSAIYRTVESYKNILSSVFTIDEITRAYPDEIESKYGTKHYYFICRRK